MLTLCASKIIAHLLASSTYASESFKSPSLSLTTLIASFLCANSTTKKREKKIEFIVVINLV